MLAELTSEEKYCRVENQVRMLEDKIVLEFHCPYCGMSIPTGSSLCCEKFRATIKAVIEQQAREKIGRFYS